MALALAMLALPLAGGALESDRSQPMDITANYQKTQLDAGAGEGGTTLLQGDVRMQQGSLQARAAEARVRQHPSSRGGGVQDVVLTGQPALLQQDQTGGRVHIQAQRIEYELESGLALLRGNVEVRQQGRGEFRGQSMRYNTRTGEIEGGDRSPGSRVRLTIPPRQPAAPAGDDTPRANDGS